MDRRRQKLIQTIRGNHSEEETIRTCKRPVDAKYTGKKVTLRSNWNQIKIDVMKHALQAKFSQHPQLAKNLIATDNKILIHEAPWDNYWGNGKDGNGENILGRLLMALRTTLQ